MCRCISGEFRRWLLVICCALSAAVSGGTVRTVEGKVYEGEIRLDQGQIVVGNTRLGIEEVLDARFREIKFDVKDRVRQDQVRIDKTSRTQDVGPTGTPGSSTVVGGTYFLKGNGARIGSTEDSFYFLYHELNGEGQIIANLGSVAMQNPRAQVGVMIRERYNERGSKCAFLSFTPQAGWSFGWREQDGGEMTTKPAAPQTTTTEGPPTWLRLVRTRRGVCAFRSIDGENWMPVGETVEIAMDQRIYAGLAVCSGDPTNVTAASFNNVNILPGHYREAATLKMVPINRPNEPALSRAIALRNGAVIANAQIDSADEQSLHLRRDGKPMTLPISQIARMILTPVPQQQLSRIPPAVSGVLLARGDFMEGDFQSMTNGRVKIQSVVFGPAELAMGNEAQVVVFHDILGPDGTTNWIVRTNEGNVYVAKSAQIDRDSLVVEDELTGTARIHSATLLELKAGRGRLESLCDLPLEKVKAAHGESELAAYSLPSDLSLLEHSKEHPLLVHGGASLTYNLDGKYKTLLFRAGVTEATLPMVAARIIVSVDGKEAYRSDSLTGLEDPRPAVCAVSGGKLLSIRVEAVGDANLPCDAALSNAMLVK